MFVDGKDSRDNPVPMVAYGPRITADLMFYYFAFGTGDIVPLSVRLVNHIEQAVTLI